jgi:hypothetical protein
LRSSTSSNPDRLPEIRQEFHAEQSGSKSDRNQGKDRESASCCHAVALVTSPAGYWLAASLLRKAGGPVSSEFLKMSGAALDYDSLMQANLTRVFNERDAARRFKAAAELYADDALLYETDCQAKGRAAICDTVEVLWSHLAPDFRFRATDPPSAITGSDGCAGKPDPRTAPSPSPGRTSPTSRAAASTPSSCGIEGALSPLILPPRCRERNNS